MTYSYSIKSCQEINPLKEKEIIAGWLWWWHLAHCILLKSWGLSAISQQNPKFFLFPGSISKPEDFEQFIHRVGAGPYVCQICSYQQARFEVVKNHVESKHFPDTFTYPCPSCDAVLGTNTALKRHQQRHHNSNV